MFRNILTFNQELCGLTFLRETTINRTFLLFCFTFTILFPYLISEMYVCPIVACLSMQEKKDNYYEKKVAAFPKIGAKEPNVFFHKV